MDRRLRFATGALLVALAIGACGGGASPQGPGGSTGPGASSGGGATNGPGQATGPVTADDPCGLLSADEVWAVLNSDPLTATAAPPFRCVYLPAGGAQALVIDYYAKDGAAQFATFADNPTYQAVEGVGDRAIGNGSELFFLLGDRLIQLRANWGGTEKDRVAVLLMARIIIARLTTGNVPAGLIPTTPPVLSAKTACDLLTGEEAASVLNGGPLTASSNQYAQQFCTYTTATGEVVLSTYLDPKDGIAAWDSFAATIVAEPVSGLGTKAMFEPGTYILFVLVGDTIIHANVLTFGIDAEQALDVDRQLMEIMLTHL